MKTLARVASSLALVCTILPPVLYLTGRLDLATAQGWMLVGTVLWFASAPVWVGRQ